jgi:hypothetical protein
MNALGSVIAQTSPPARRVRPVRRERGRRAWAAGCGRDGRPRAAPGVPRATRAPRGACWPPLRSCIAGGVTAGLLTALVGCAGGPTPTVSPPQQAPARRPGPAQTAPLLSPVPGGPAADRGRSDRAAALAAYAGFWVVAQTLDSQPPARWRPLLAAVAADPLLSAVLSGLRGEAALGHRQYGQVIPRPRLVAAAARRVSILDCQDASRSGLSDIDTGLPVTAGSARTPLAAVLEKSRDGKWRLVQARYLPGTCQP